jgi:hypothetical protein
VFAAAVRIPPLFSEDVRQSDRNNMDNPGFEVDDDGVKKREDEAGGKRNGYGGDSTSQNAQEEGESTGQTRKSSQVLFKNQN